MTWGNREWRVRWRRPTWRATTGKKGRLFASRGLAERFVSNLQELGPVDVEITYREVGPWREG